MAKKKKTPVNTTSKPPVRRGKALNTWIDPVIYDALQAYLDAQRFRPTATSVVESLLAEFLQREGYLPEQPQS